LTHQSAALVDEQMHQSSIRGADNTAIPIDEVLHQCCAALNRSPVVIGSNVGGPWPSVQVVHAIRTKSQLNSHADAYPRMFGTTKLVFPPNSGVCHGHSPQRQRF